MKRSFHLVFAGGGTAGHLFPGLAVAEQLAAAIPRLRITFAGSGKEFERRHVAAAGFDYCPLPCRPLPRRAREAVSFVLENFVGYLAAKRFLKEEQVGAVVGLGGYASVPMGRAAVRRRIPLVLLEQNVLPGRATRCHRAVTHSSTANMHCWPSGGSPPSRRVVGHLAHFGVGHHHLDHAGSARSERRRAEIEADRPGGAFRP